MSVNRRILIAAALVLSVLVGTVAAETAKVWKAVGQTDNGVTVEVVDMGPVCLYIATRSVYGGRSVAMWGVAKPQLPMGRGCQ
jgi:hypothetical protein